MHFRAHPVRLSVAGLVILLAGCSGHSRYSMSHDQTPTNPPKLEWIEDAHPQIEPLSAGGNSDYKVDGKRYHVWRGIKSYEQVGYASWYGMKFHGHRTSNGEIYDMYSMSAAHKNLPLPSYVRVTNLANKRSVIVRVNDRGPFHSDRIIDLSYAAAYKLDMLGNGTAQVRVTLLSPKKPNDEAHTTAVAETDPKQPKSVEAPAKSPTAAVPEKQIYVQLLALKDATNAKQRQQSLIEQGYPAVIFKSGNWTRLRVGPYANRQLAEQAKEKMRSQYENAFLVTEKPPQD